MSTSKVKFMCSSGGKILPRPSDMKLRYVGGETRMISVPHTINYNAFEKKMMETYGPDIVFRYQLPEEDLDALVSVSCDEDLENMMEECDRLNVIGGSSKLRVFVFLKSDLDVTDLPDISLDHKTSEQKFVDAVNSSAAIDIVSSVMQNKFSMFAEGSIGSDNNMNDAYEAWNGIEKQGRGVSHMNKNLQSEVWPTEGHLSFQLFTRTEDNPNNLKPHPFPQLPHDTIRKQQLGFLGNSVSPSDSFTNLGMYSGAPGINDVYDLENADSAFSSHLEPKSKFLEKKLSPVGSPRLLQEEKLSIYQSEDKDEERGNPGINMNLLDVNEGFKSSDAHLGGDQFSLSPGAFLQKQLHEKFQGSDAQIPNDQFSLSPGALLQKQLHENHRPVRNHSKNLLFVSDDEPPATIGRPKKHELDKQILYEQRNDDYDWDRFPIYDASPASDLATADNSGPSIARSFIDSEVQTLSTSIKNPKYEKRLQQGIGNMHHPYLETIPAMGSVDEGQQPYAHSQEFPDNLAIHSQHNEKFMHLQWTPPDPFLSSENYEEGMLSLGNHQGWPNLSENYTGSSTNIISAGGHKSDDKEFLPYLDKYQSQSLPYLEQDPPGKVTMHKAERETDNLKEALSSIVDDFSALEMVENLLQSTRRVDCTPAKCSLDGSLGSNKAGEIETLEDFMLSGKKRFNDPEQRMIHDALPSKEEFEKIVSATFMDTSNEGIQRKALSGMKDTANHVMLSGLVSIPPTTTLIDSWEAWGERDTSVVPQLGLHEKPMEDQIVLVSDVNKETVAEEYRVDLEEVEGSNSSNYVSTDPVASAEAAARIHGLQVIKNCDLEELRELGSGTFGTVYHGKWRGTDVAIKRIKASCFSGREAERQRLMDDFWREAIILGKLHHPNVVAFYGVVPDGPGGTLATVTEYMVNGSLKQVLQNKDRTLDRRKRLLIAMDAAFGMEYLHAKNVVHFDIKCENLLVNLRDVQRPICKVADLGLSKVKQQTFVSGGVRGTLPWMAPELLNGNSNLVSEKVDVFSFGIVMWELLTGEEPYANMHYGAIIGGIVNNTLRPTVPKWCDVGWKTLMERCWAADPADRPTFAEVAATLRAMEASLPQNPKGQIFKQ